MSLDTSIRAVQKKLGVGADGKPGPETWTAIHVAVIGKKPAAEKAAGHGIIIKVISAMRTFAEQDELFTQGRKKAGKVVTNARGGFSNHNFGIAFDIGIFKGSTDPEKAKTFVPESPLYKVIGALGTDLGLEWGGNWTSIKDEPHFQLRPAWADGMKEKNMLAELRTRKASGKDFFA